MSYKEQIEAKLEHLEGCVDAASELRATIILCTLAIIETVQSESTDIVNAIAAAPN